MGYLTLAHRKPAGASCAWVQRELSIGAPYLYWRPVGQGCACNPCKIILNGGSHTIVANTTIGGASNPGVSWGGGTASTCGTFGTYFSAETNPANYVGLLFDVWKALADGAWTSSIALTLTRWNNSATGLYAGNPNGFQFPTGSPYANVAAPIAGTGFWSACTTAGAVTNTLTIYDDGQITLA